MIAPARAADVTSSWVNAASGTWSAASNWNSAFFPNNGNGGLTYAAVIGPTGSPYTVTLNTPVTINDLTLNSANATLAITTTGTLSVLSSPINLQAGSLQLVGATINGGTINLSGGLLVFTNSGGVLNGTSVTGNLLFNQPAARVEMRSGADFTGSATLSGSSTILNYEYNATLGAGRAINLESSGAFLSVSRNTAGASDSTFTIASGASVRGLGNITSGQFTSGTTNTVVNNGTLSADEASTTLFMNPDRFTNNAAASAINGGSLNVSAATFTNNGSIVVGSPTSQLSINSTNWSNAATGSISITGTATTTFGGNWSNAGAIGFANGTLNLGGTFTTAGIGAISRSGGTVNLTGSLNNSANTLALTASTGSWRLLGGTITGGTITRSGGADLIFTNNSGILSGTSVPGDINLSDPVARVELRSGADFTGNATLSASSSILGYEYNTTLAAGRVITLANVSSNLSISRNSVAGTDSTLTIASGAMVHGTGNITSGNFTSGIANTILNNGTIAADVASNTLTINPNIFTNNGALQCTSGATLTLNADTFTNNGSLVVSGASALNMSSTNWSNAPGGTMSITGTSTTTFSGNWSNGGTINFGTGTINLSGTFTIAGLGTFNRSGGTVNLIGTLNNASNTFAMTALTGSWRLLGGTINGGTITRSGGADLVFTSGGGILSGTSITGDVTLSDPSSRVEFRNGADFTGNATLSGSSSILNYEYNATIGVGRTINLLNANANLGVSRNTTTSADSTLTIAAGALVHGQGDLSSGFFTSGTTNTILNAGTIAADIVSTPLTINPNIFINNGALQSTSGGSLNINATTFTNNGSIVVSGASPLTIASTNWSNAATGSMSLTGTSTTNFSGDWSNAGSIGFANGTLNLGGTFTVSNLGAFSRSGGTINVVGTLNNASSTFAMTASTGSWRLLGGTVNGGTITRSGGADLVFTSSGGILSGTSITGDVTLSDPSVRVEMRNGADFTGNATLSGSSTILNYEYNATIGAGRTINLTGSNATVGVSRNTTSASDSTLTISSGALVRGQGQVTSGQFTAGTTNTILNNGTVAADVTGQTLTVNPNVFTNNGRVEAVNGATVNFSAGLVNSSGTLRAAGGGKFLIAGLTGNLNGSIVDGASSLMRITSGTYTINQPLAVTNGAVLNLQGSWTRSATIDASGKIVFDYTGASPFASIQADIITGRNGGAWNGPGINSSAAAGSVAFGVGYAESSALFTSFPNNFAGESVDSTAVLVRLTYNGDANLDGKVDTIDFNALAANFGGTSKVWSQADFNYDGKVDTLDFNNLAANFGKTAPGESGGGGGAGSIGALVPEPAGVMILSAAGALVASTARARSRRRSQTRR